MFKCCSAQDYPSDRLEIILVNNHSEDQSLNLLLNYAASDQRVRVIDLTPLMNEDRTYKKEALTEGIKVAGGEIILTTDADCTFGPQWASSMVENLIGKEWRIVTGPVSIQGEKSFWHHYQALEYAGLMVATGGGIGSGCLIMGNGANLAYYRNDFSEGGGYRGIPSLTSGDDVFLLQQKYARAPDSVGFVKDPRSMVSTWPVSDLSALLNQRKRWSTKAATYRHHPSFYVAILVFLNSLLLCSSFILCFWRWTPFLGLFIIQGMVKVIFDQRAIREGLDFAGKSTNVAIAAGSHLLNPVITVVVFFLGLLRPKYVWKGRVTS